ncbi:MAG: N-6 DNA methylase [Polyangiaceae bacterium]|nr:N-6 DNA methylase [Polyangiaceae bacterium]
MRAAEIEELFEALARDAGLRDTEPTRAARAIVTSFVGAELSRSSLLGAAYERALAPTSRRAGGVHYTPDTLVARVVVEAFGALAPARRAAPFVLDPAMGCGAFLCATLREIVRHRGGGESVALRREIALACLHGIDVDESAVRAARRALWLEVADPSLPLDAFDENLVCGDALLDAPFDGRASLDWRRAFCRVFVRVPSGFDLVLGNPPFLGGKRIRTVHGDRYAGQLGALHPGANKNVDLSAHFLRRGFDALADGGVLGFITTNTISQGDTREGGLAHVLRSGGALVAADRSVPWPGAAGVVVSLLWLTRGPPPARARLDGDEVDHIDAFLSPLSTRKDPEKLPEMRRRAFIGCFLRGSGFVLDDDSARELLARAPESREILRPFMGGEEVLKDPLQRPHRWVIHFGPRTLDEARAHPALFEIVRDRVRPFREARRATKADAAHRASWWRFANPRPELEAATRDLSHVIVIPRMSSDVVAARIANTTVFSDQLVVVASSSFAVFAALSSRAHEAWARFTGSTLGRGLRYTPSDTLETFPLPARTFDALERDLTLEGVGRRLDEARAAALASRGVGLSRLRRLLAAPPATDVDLEGVRAAKAAVDRAVCEAYGWPSSAALEDDRSLVRRLLELNRERARPLS